MSQQLDGSFICNGNGCGVDVGNGSVVHAAFISDLDPDDPAQTRRGHLCREPRDDAPGGCAGLYLGTLTY